LPGNGALRRGAPQSGAQDQFIGKFYRLAHTQR
jgi:hypothetical protein